MTWYDRSMKVIFDTYKSLPEGTPAKEVRRALRDAYPFGSRELYPYKAWCKAQREFLEKIGAQTRNKTAPLTPIELFISEESKNASSS